METEVLSVWVMLVQTGGAKCGVFGETSESCPAPCVTYCPLLGTLVALGDSATMGAGDVLPLTLPAHGGAECPPSHTSL